MIIHSTDIMEEWQLLHFEKEELTGEEYDSWYEENGERYDMLMDFVSLMEMDPRWPENMDFISDSKFNDFLYEGAENVDGPFPDYLAIDWEATIDGMKQDYTSITFDGETFWYRS